MIVFTLVNERTDEVWVGTTREDVSPEARFKQFQDALELGIDHPFYEELKTFGPDAFSVNLFAAAQDPAEMKMFFEEALETYNGKSLAGIKTVRPGTAKKAQSTTSKSSPSAARKAPARESSRVATKPAKEKLPSGRTGSAAKERRIKEAIEAEKAAIAAAKAKQAAEEAAEMRAIIARLDARGSTLRKR